jgi:DNA-binding response OmpR family regulator
VAADGVAGLRRAQAASYDLIVLDLMLPGVCGLDVLRELRAGGSKTPILVLTARDEPDDVVRGLDLGADDYLTKPFRMAELCARAKALVRRAYDRPDPIIAAGRLRINSATREVSCGGVTQHLPAMEYRLLEYLALRSGEVVSKEDLVERLYDFNSDRASNVLEVYVSQLRKRFGAGVIRTVRGHGYALVGGDA